MGLILCALLMHLYLYLLLHEILENVNSRGRTSAEEGSYNSVPFVTCLSQIKIALGRTFMSVFRDMSKELTISITGGYF